MKIRKKEFLSFPLCMHVCMCIYMCVPMLVGTCVEVRRWHWEPSPIGLHFIHWHRAHSNPELSGKARLASSLLWGFPVSPSRHWSWSPHPPGIYVGSENPNFSSQVGMASDLATEPSPEPHAFLLSLSSYSQLLRELYCILKSFKIFIAWHILYIIFPSPLFFSFKDEIIFTILIIKKWPMHNVNNWTT